MYYNRKFSQKSRLQINRSKKQQDKTVQPFLWFDTNVVEMQSDADLYQKRTVDSSSNEMFSYLSELHKIT